MPVRDLLLSLLCVTSILVSSLAAQGGGGGSSGSGSAGSSGSGTGGSSATGSGSAAGNSGTSDSSRAGSSGSNNQAFGTTDNNRQSNPSANDSLSGNNRDTRPSANQANDGTQGSASTDDQLRTNAARQNLDRERDLLWRDDRDRRQSLDRDNQFQSGRSAGSLLGSDGSSRSRSSANSRSSRGADAAAERLEADESLDSDSVDGGVLGRDSERRTERRQLDDQDAIGVSFNRNDKDLLVVADVTPRSVAGRAGLLPGDQIISVDGYQLTTRSQFNRWLARRAGAEVALDVLRDGERRTVQLVSPYAVGFRGTSADTDLTIDPTREPTNQARDRDRSDSQGYLGVKFDSRYGEAPIVMRVYRDSPAARAGVRAGDEILTINGNRVRTADEVIDAVSQLEPGRPVRIAVIQAQPTELILRLGSRNR
jgi:hypothetical protein